MTQTVTSTLGYGIRINPDAFTEKTGYNQERYTDGYLDEKKFPLLHIAYEGIASISYQDKPNHWIFIKPGLSKIYSGVSGNGLHSPVNITDLDPEELTEAVKQLNQWREEYGHENIFPQWNMALWIN